MIRRLACIYLAVFAVLVGTIPVAPTFTLRVAPPGYPLHP